MSCFITVRSVIDNEKPVIQIPIDIIEAVEVERDPTNWKSYSNGETFFFSEFPLTAKELGEGFKQHRLKVRLHRPSSAYEVKAPTPALQGLDGLWGRVKVSSKGTLYLKLSKGYDETINDI